MARKFDCIIIGSGLGGLTAGALCARAGLKVLVLERNDNFGGAATVYKHNGLSIEASLHEINGFDAEDPKLPLIQSLGLDKDLHLVSVGNLFEVRGGVMGEPFSLPQGFEAALAETTKRFPQHKAALAEYFRRLKVLRMGVSGHMADPVWWLTKAPEAMGDVWPLIREGRASVSEVMNELFGADEAVKVAIAANLYYYHDDPDETPFLHFALAQASFLAGGYYVRGGSQALTDRLVALIKEAGGILETGREVDELLIVDNRIAGVSHRGRGTERRSLDEAPLVFSNAAPHVMEGMLPEEKRPAFFLPYANRALSITLWTISLGLSKPARDFGVTNYSTIILPNWMERLSQFRDGATLMRQEPGEHLPPYFLVDYQRIDSGLNRNGPYLCSVSGVDRLENWLSSEAGEKKSRKQRWISALLADLDRLFPGIASAVVHREISTAETFHHYLNTPDGAVYGFAPSVVPPAGPRTSIDGLWLTSAFTFAGGFSGAMLGGASAVSQAMRKVS